MNRETKTFTAEVKAAPAGSPDAGTFTAVVSVFGNIDRGGDRVMPGAFTKTLAEWAAKGDPIPVIWSHEWDDPFANVGFVEDARETDVGLEVKGRLDIDRDFAAQVNHLLVTRRVTQFSFGYFPTNFAYVEDPTYGTVREIYEVELFEVGPTLVGMNQDTELVEAASALRRDAKAGRVLSTKNEQKIRSAYDTLGEVLSTLTTAETPKSFDPPTTTIGGDISTTVTFSTKTATVEEPQTEETTEEETPETAEATADEVSPELVAAVIELLTKPRAASLDPQ